MYIAVPDYGTHAHSLSLFLWENAWGRMPGALRSYLGYSDVYDVKWLVVWPGGNTVSSSKPSPL